MPQPQSGAFGATPVPADFKLTRVIVSGLHSPLEQQVLRSLLRRNGHAVKVLARCFSASGYHLAKEEQDAFENGRLLIVSAFGADKHSSNSFVPTLIAVSFKEPNIIFAVNSKFNFSWSQQPSWILCLS